MGRAIAVTGRNKRTAMVNKYLTLFILYPKGVSCKSLILRCKQKVNQFFVLPVLWLNQE